MLILFFNLFLIYFLIYFLLGKSDSENFLTKIKILLHFNLIVTKIKMQQKSQFC